MGGGGGGRGRGEEREMEKGGRREGGGGDVPAYGIQWK